MEAYGLGRYAMLQHAHLAELVQQALLLAQAVLLLQLLLPHLLPGQEPLPPGVLVAPVTPQVAGRAAAAAAAPVAAAALSVVVITLAVRKVEMVLTAAQQTTVSLCGRDVADANKCKPYKPEACLGSGCVDNPMA